MRSSRATQGALAILACGSTILWFALWQKRTLGETPGADLSALLLFCVGSGWLAARFIARFRTRLPIETSAVYRLLQDQPDNVIWIFAHPINWQMAGLRFEVGQDMFLLTKDGLSHKIPGVTKGTQAVLEATLRRLVPRARFGWSEENRMFYKQKTGLLVR